MSGYGAVLAPPSELQSKRVTPRMSSVGAAEPLPASMQGEPVERRTREEHDTAYGTATVFSPAHGDPSNAESTAWTLQ